MDVELLDYMGTDLDVANAARVSFNKQKEAFDDSDGKLIKYLAKHNHWTPFGQVQLKFRFKVPLFVARQHFRHTIGSVKNEVSRRYVTYEPEFYFPKTWRKKPEGSIKQGSGEDFGEKENKQFYEYLERNCRRSLDFYKVLLMEGVCPEQARMVLPQNMYTEYIETGSLAYYARFCKLRGAPDAQEEIRQIADKVSEAIEVLFPVSWKALMD